MKIGRSQRGSSCALLIPCGDNQFLLQSYDFLVKPSNNMREYLGKPTFFSIFA